MNENNKVDRKVFTHLFLSYSDLFNQASLLIKIDGVHFKKL